MVFESFDGYTEAKDVPTGFEKQPHRGGNGPATFLDNVDKSTWCVLAYNATYSFNKVSGFRCQEKET
jgi:hypothetical protein